MQLPKFTKHATIGAIVVLTVLFLGGCRAPHHHDDTVSDVGKGAAAGAVLGGIIGHQSDETAEGAAVGAATGAAIGAVTGDDDDEDKH